MENMILQPIVVGGQTFKNRIMFPPLTTGYEKNGMISEQDMGFYTRLAKGGVGYIVLGDVAPINSFSPTPKLFDDSQIPAFKALADSVHAYGTKLGIQIFHPEYDVDAINAAFLMGMAQMTDQWAVPGSATYNDSLNHFTYDPEKAKSLLAEAGYADGFTTNIITISGMSDMLTAIANMLDEVGIHCNIQQVDSATNNQYMKDGTWEGLMLHFATIAPDLGLYMGRHLDKNGAYYAKGIQHPDKEMELLEEIRRCMDPDEKHKLEKELQAAIYDAEDGSCLFGRVLYVNKSSMYKYDYVIDDHATEAFIACWDLSACWLNK